MTAIKVRAVWSSFDGDGFALDPDSATVLDARVTPKTIRVALPRGGVEVVKRFDRFGVEQTKWRVRYVGLGHVPKFIDITRDA